MRNKGASRETSMEALSVFPARDKNDDWGDSCRGGEKWFDSGHILKAEPTGFANGSDEGYKRKSRG